MWSSTLPQKDSSLIRTEENNNKKNPPNNHEGKKNTNTNETTEAQQNDADEESERRQVKSRHLGGVRNWERRRVFVSTQSDFSCSPSLLHLRALSPWQRRPASRGLQSRVSWISSSASSGREEILAGCCCGALLLELRRCSVEGKRRSRSLGLMACFRWLVSFSSFWMES